MAKVFSIAGKARDMTSARDWAIDAADSDVFLSGDNDENDDGYSVFELSEIEEILSARGLTLINATEGSVVKAAV